MRKTHLCCPREGRRGAAFKMLRPVVLSLTKIGPFHRAAVLFAKRRPFAGCARLIRGSPHLARDHGPVVCGARLITGLSRKRVNRRARQPNGTRPPTLISEPEGWNPLSCRRIVLHDIHAES